LDKFTKDDSKTIEWASKDYEFELALHKEEYARLVKSLTEDLTNCDQECVEECTNGEWVQFFESPRCLSQCRCEVDFARI